MTFKRRLRWGVAALVLVAAAAGGLRAWQTRGPALQPAPVPAVVRATTSKITVPAWGERAARAVTVPTAAPAAPSSPADKEFVEVCGVGRMKRSELERREGDPPPVWLAAWERQSERGALAVIERLDAGPLRQRVAAALLRDDVQGAAALAASTTDATAYGLALRACRGDASQRIYRASSAAQPPVAVASGASMPELPPLGPLPTACSALNMDKLESLDPSAAWPWVMRIEEGLATGNPSAVSEALYQFAQRPRSASPRRAFSAALAEVVGAEPTRAEAMALMLALGKDMAQFDSAPTAVSRACRSEVLRDANRRQLCEQSARRLPDMTTELLEAAVLHSLEERLGISHSRQALPRSELNRLSEVALQDSMKWLEEPSCANFAHMGRLAMKLARDGELAHARELLKDSPASAPR